MKVGVPKKESKYTEAWCKIHAPHLIGVLEACWSSITKGRSMLLMGGTGRGKSACAVLSARRWLERERTNTNPMHMVQDRMTCRYIYVPDFLSMLRDTFNNREGDTEAKLFRDMLKPDLLVFDDLGADYNTDWVRAQIGRIIHGRLVQERPTIVTTNLPLSKIGSRNGIKEEYGLRVHSRLLEYQHMYVHDEMPDLRKAREHV
jgi:DNA replication protein DnaC